MLLQHAQLQLMPAKTSLQLLIAGPYRSGTGDDPAKMAANVAAMEAQCLPLYAAGHMPVRGEWLALPMLALAGSKQVGDAVYEELFHTHCERLLSHCDAVLRLAGASSGADRMMAVARGLGLPIYCSLDEVPAALRPSLGVFMRGKTEYQDEAGRRMIYAYDLAAWASDLIYGAGLPAPLPLASLNVAELRAATLQQAA